MTFERGKSSYHIGFIFVMVLTIQHQSCDWHHQNVKKQTIQRVGSGDKRGVHDNFDEAEHPFHWQTSDDDDFDESRIRSLVGWQS